MSHSFAYDQSSCYGGCVKTPCCPTDKCIPPAGPVGPTGLNGLDGITGPTGPTGQDILFESVVADGFFAGIGMSGAADNGLLVFTDPALPVTTNVIYSAAPRDTITVPDIGTYMFTWTVVISDDLDSAPIGVNLTPIIDGDVGIVERALVFLQPLAAGELYSTSGSIVFTTVATGVTVGLLATWVTGNLTIESTSSYSLVRLQ